MLVKDCIYRAFNSLGSVVSVGGSETPADNPEEKKVVMLNVPR